MTYDSKGRQCIFYQCPVKDCSSKSNQITRHLTGAKQKWTEVGASGYNGKKVSRTWFQQKLTPRDFVFEKGEKETLPLWYNHNFKNFPI